MRVLNIRKRQHNLIDIIATIQENQNRIVDADFQKNLIVQGCAGSGKTMVLLHRLSSLQYKQKHFDFGNNALILTPNPQFSLHIKGLAEGLQIGNIDRISVEEYYHDMLLRYSKDFNFDARLSSEMNVSQEYVGYIYSDQFRKDFAQAYDKVISERNSLIQMLEILSKNMGKPYRQIRTEDDTKVVYQIQFAVDDLAGLIKRQEANLDKAKEDLEKQNKRKIFLEEKVQTSERFAEDIVKETVPRVQTKIEKYLTESSTKISNLEKSIIELTNEQRRVQNTFVMLGKKAKLEEIEDEIKSTRRRLLSARKRYEDDTSVMLLPQEGKSDDEILGWMGQVMLRIKDVQDDIRLCKNSKQEVINYRNELEKELPEKILAAETAIQEISSKAYSEDAVKTVEYLNSKLAEYTLMGTFRMIFDEAVSEFRKEHDILNVNGRFHRYDLYACLLFAMKYFKTSNGTTRFMCIDEGQDLSFNEYRLLFELNQMDITFNIYGDTNQLMYKGRGISNWDELKKVFGASEYTLNENYRNTNQITRFCNNSFDMNVLLTGVDGARVRELSRKELEPELAALNITTERVAILLPRSVQKKKYLDMNTIPSNIKQIIGNKMGNGYISIMYVDEVKGIEFDKVYVVSNNMSRNEKYIAYTRALSELIVVVDENAVADAVSAVDSEVDAES